MRAVRFCLYVCLHYVCHNLCWSGVIYMSFRNLRDILIILFEFIVCTVYLHILLVSMKIDAIMQNVSVSRDTIPGFLRVF